MTNYCGGWVEGFNLFVFANSIIFLPVKNRRQLKD